MASTSITPELLAKIRTCLEARITEMTADQERIAETPSSEYRSHDEMAADDEQWDELDRKILKTRELLQKLDELNSSLVADKVEQSPELKARIERIKGIVEKLLPLLPSENSADHATDALCDDEDEYEQDDCRYCSGCHYCKDSPGFDMADEF